MVGERAGVWYFCCWMQTDGRKARGERSALGVRGLKFPARGSQGWGEHVVMAAGCRIASGGKSWRRGGRGGRRKSIYGSFC